MRNYFTFNGVNCKDFGVYVSGSKTFGSAEREYETVEVPGRNGDLVYSSSRLKNIQVDYEAFIFEEFSNNMQALRNYLLTQIGYGRLEDTYHPDEFRLGVFSAALDPEVTNLEVGQFTLSFNCKPQRFLKTGTMTTEFIQNGVIVNPSMNDSSPLIRVTGNGTLTITGKEIFTLTISSNTSYIDIDCEMMDCYRGLENMNPNVEFGDDKIPVLTSGKNSISFNSTITKVEIIPRWWVL